MRTQPSEMRNTYKESLYTYFHPVMLNNSDAACLVDCGFGALGAHGVQQRGELGVEQAAPVPLEGAGPPLSGRLDPDLPERLRHMALHLPVINT